MITAVGLRWVVTALCGLTGALCAYRGLNRVSFRDRMGDLLHVVMSVAMVAMAWPATMSVARVPQIVFFALAAVWFVTVSVAGAAHDDHGGRGVAAHHVVMMAAMAWMVFVMPRAMGGMHPMPEMSMPRDSVPADVTTVAVVLVVLFVVTGLTFLARAIGAAWTFGPVIRTLGAGTDGLMALCMALMLVTMA
ncbi:DUF5134 domain-containing protein [Amycolatopsis sp. NPDC048633]|uniref:DUF5134 domain-containing protein n=1 Tax=Amycolatopsis sp. NPDC048633 TaxID=3157095 RepID=UPI0033D5EEA6